MKACAEASDEAWWVGGGSIRWGGGWCECEGVREEVTLGGGGESGTPGRNRGSVAVALERR